MTHGWTIHHGDALEVLRTMPGESVHTCVTSPPYWGLRDYGIAGQLGLESTPDEYVSRMVEVFREVRRVLRGDGTLWLNLGDCYATGAGKVGECPGGGEQGEKWKGYRGTRRSGKHEYVDAAMGPLTQPNRLPIPGLKPKDLCGMPWRVAFALQADGWWLRSDIIWAKDNPMPESVTDRPTKAHEYLFLLAKSERYYFDSDAIKEPSVTGDERRPYASQGAWDMDGRPPEQRHGGEKRRPKAWDNDMGSHRTLVQGYGRKCGPNALRGQGANRDHETGAANRDGRDMQEVGVGAFRNKRTVWSIATAPFPEAHFATFPPKLVEPCILAGCPEGGTVLDPFSGAGTTGLVARRLGRNFVGIELNAAYIEMAERRIVQDQPLFNTRTLPTEPAEGFGLGTPKDVATEHDSAE